jgi:hypothetical protein
MKAKHWLGIALVLVGGLYVLHIWTQHGGVSGFKSGLSVTR